MLCQIERACAYADRFCRTVVVDTREHLGRTFRDRLSRYFKSLQANLVLEIDGVRARLDSLDVAPGFLAGRVNGRQARFDTARAMFVDAQVGEPLTFVFELDSAEPVLFHHMSGGGVGGVRELARLALQPDLVETLKTRLAVIGPRYVGLHIRNTDYRARYSGLLERLGVDPASRIFVATDSRQSLADCRAVFGAERVFGFADLPQTDGVTLHHITAAAQLFERNRDAILDVVMLGLASQLHMFELEPNPYGSRFSGFSLLGANLNGNRQVLAQLVGGEAALRAMLAGVA